MYKPVQICQRVLSRITVPVNTLFVLSIVLLGVSVSEAKPPDANEELVKQIETVSSEVKKVGQPKCSPCSVVLESGNSLPMDFCKNPAKYICDKKHNPFLDGIQKVEDKFEQLRTQAEDEVSATFKGRRSPIVDFEFCRMYLPDDRKKCVSAVEAKLSESVYTEDRIRKAEGLFQEAKKRYLQFLNNQMTHLNPETDKAEIWRLNKMLEKIDVMKIRFGTSHEYSVSSYNAGYSPNKNVFTVMGLILLVDDNPEVLLETILHEIGHALSPFEVELQVTKDYAGYPFKHQMTCFKNKGSVGAKATDLDCIRNLVKSEKDGQYWKEVLKLAEVNPDNDYHDSLKCQQGQLDEVFSDWISYEAYWSGPNAQSEPERIDSFQKLFSKQAPLMKAISHFCDESRQPSKNRETNLGSHPLASDRINFIFLAHPRTNAAIGCPSKRIEVFQSNRNYDSSPLGEDQALYCGNSSSTAGSK